MLCCNFTFETGLFLKVNALGNCHTWPKFSCYSRPIKLYGLTSVFCEILWNLSFLAHIVQNTTVKSLGLE